MIQTIRYWKLLPDFVAAMAVVLCQLALAKHFWDRAPLRHKRTILLATAASVTLVLWGFSLLTVNVSSLFPANFVAWGRGLSLAWAGTSLALGAALLVMSKILPVHPHHHPARRTFLRTVQGAVFGAPMAALGYGVFVQRNEIRLREENIAIPGLPKDLDGLRLVQLTDIHMGAFLDRRQLEWAVRMANETKAHVGLVTGDLISYQGDPLDECIDLLARLRTDAGVYGCLGNHEVYAEAEAYTAEQAAKRGIRFLRHQHELVNFGNATVNFAGVDYQRKGRLYLPGAERLTDPSAFNVLLSHNPDVFPAAAAKGFPLTISGHTHGGQVRVEILRQDLNVARFFTPYVDGVYQEGGSTVFVSRGIGTIGMPARLGAPPEVALIRLWCS